MNKKMLAVMASAVLLVVIVVLVALIPSKDICSDDVRGYESTASSSLDATRENLSRIKASIAVEEGRKVPVQLDGLSATHFAALKACDTQCKLLGRCLRFVFMRPPSQACPVEYADYKTRTEAALKLLEGLNRIEVTSKEAAQKAEALGRSRQDVEEFGIDKSGIDKSGSTGGREAVLKARVQQLKKDLSQDLSFINEQIDGLLQNQTGSAAR